MKIGLDGIPLASRKTGIGHYTLELARELARLSPDDEFELLSPVPFASSLEQNRPNLRQVEAARRRFWFILGLPHYIRRHSLALFHGTNYEVPWWNLCPTILTVHDLSLLLHPETHESRLVRRARHRLPLMARWATKIITATDFMKREVSEHLKIGEEKIVVTPYAPRHNFRPLPQSETEQTRARLGIEDVFILFVGTIEPRKNLRTLVAAFDELLKTTDLRPQLVIAGPKGWLMEEALNYPAGDHLVGRINLTGYVSEEDLRALYSSCTVCVYPSLYEGFGLPPLEAMACGAPVIASDVPSLAETVGKAALLFPPKDVQKLTRSLVEVLSDEGKRDYFSQAGLKHAAQFTWERTAQLTLDVYREVSREFPRKSPKAQREI